MHMHTLVPYFHEFFSHSHQNSNLCFHDIFEYLLYCNETSILDYLLMHFKIFTKFLQKKKQRKKMNNQICCTQCGDYGNFLSHFFGKTFVKATFLLKKLLNRWFDEFFLVRVNFSSFHSTLWCTIIPGLPQPPKEWGCLGQSGGAQTPKKRRFLDFIAFLCDNFQKTGGARAPPEPWMRHPWI